MNFLTAKQAHDASMNPAVADKIRRHEKMIEYASMGIISEAIEEASAKGMFEARIGAIYSNHADKLRQLGYSVDIDTTPSLGPDFGSHMMDFGMRISWDKRERDDQHECT